MMIAENFFNMSSIAKASSSISGLTVSLLGLFKSQTKFFRADVTYGQMGWESASSEHYNWTRLLYGR